jgi:hypothetical protein
MAGIALSGFAQIATSLLQTIFEWLSAAVCFSEDRQRLTPLRLIQIEASGEVMDATLGERFVVVMAASRGLPGEEENEGEKAYQSAHSSYLSS